MSLLARIAWTGRLRPDKIDEYVFAHANVWPDVLSAIRDAGIRNYSIYLFGDRVFGYYECDDPESAVSIEAASEATQRWRTAMRDLFDDEVTQNGPTYLPEIFRLDERSSINPAAASVAGRDNPSDPTRP